MATFYDHITPEQAALISQMRIFFVASADPALKWNDEGAGPVNLSPKGSALLHVIDPRRVAYLDYSGSGNETARHVSAGGPITLMVCSFDDNAAIVRLYGTAQVVSLDESPLAKQLLDAAPPEGQRPLKARQVIDVRVEKTMTSCGYGVPLIAQVDERAKDQRGRKYK
ncbi:MAG TPA: pyridoxamine 5'-phosphate oxidase family protein [Thermoflexales bacterium]|nr:pyridoxamine 5'-phosphate oxidase family protein [Thermoflexales bacterium]HQW36026.1 pyridoxamine 5'-phosphate oxidase family protein [Thermoflexales bacterium]HQZ22668.1 pyridoxamine 5'-phosphate oxidase family protein [Thermoflexales bacterium]HRA00240.1 pyridoxamine 5'-phosphate oxidase family protein [Thermoflexales bacterium]